MEKAKPVLQARPVKKPVRAKVRDEADAPEYAKGGSVKGWGKARGARACKMR
jgi:hypothetical protein